MISVLFVVVYEIRPRSWWTFVVNVSMPTLEFWILFLAFPGAFAAQVATRVRLIATARNNFSIDHVGFRVRRLLVDVLAQRKTIVERPAAGISHALVFWGFSRSPVIRRSSSCTASGSSI